MSTEGGGTIEQVFTWIDGLPKWGKATIVGGTVLVLYIPYRIWATQPRKSVYKEDWEKDVVYLYQPPRTKAVPNLSPYCLKVETWLRMSDIHYEIPKIGWHMKSKEGTLPFVELNGVEYHDSNFIIRDLDKIIQHQSIEEHLSDEQKATSRAFEAMTEKSLAISAWVPRLENIDKMVDLFDPKAFGLFAPILKLISLRTWGSLLNKRIQGTDFGFHSREDRISIGIEDLKSISDYVGKKHFFHGFKPTKIDACLFANLAQILYAPYESEHKTIITTECSNLAEYVDRIKHRFWPDWEESTVKFGTDTNWKKRPSAIRNGKHLNNH